jgi:hypothetical protein
VQLGTAEATQMLAYNDANVFEKAFDGNMTSDSPQARRQLPTRTRAKGQRAANRHARTRRQRRRQQRRRRASRSLALVDVLYRGSRAPCTVAERLDQRRCADHHAADGDALGQVAIVPLAARQGFDYLHARWPHLGADFVSRADLALTMLGSLAQVTRPSDNSLVANANVTV